MLMLSSFFLTYRASCVDLAGVCCVVICPDDTAAARELRVVEASVAADVVEGAGTRVSCAVLPVPACVL